MLYVLLPDLEVTKVSRSTRPLGVVSAASVCCSCLGILQHAAVAQPLSAMRHVARGEVETRNSRWSLIGSDPLEGRLRYYCTSPLRAEATGERSLFPPLFPCLLDGAPYCCPVPIHYVCYHGGIASASAVLFRRRFLPDGFFVFSCWLS
jgi:hypothetical protein